MTKQNDQLGRLIIPEDIAERDAIHIAIMPAIAGESLVPGMRVRIEDGKAMEGSAPDSPIIGIVDPFLAGFVYRNQKFWVCLIPNTITSLRHIWTHPQIDKEEVSSGEEKCILEKMVSSCGLENIQELVNAAHCVKTVGHYTFNTTFYAEISEDDWGVFWRYYEKVTGQVRGDHTNFSCTC